MSTHQNMGSSMDPEGLITRRRTPEEERKQPMERQLPAKQEGPPQKLPSQEEEKEKKLSAPQKTTT